MLTEVEIALGIGLHIVGSLIYVWTLGQNLTWCQKAWCHLLVTLLDGAALYLLPLGVYIFMGVLPRIYFICKAECACGCCAHQEDATGEASCLRRNLDWGHDVVPSWILLIVGAGLCGFTYHLQTTIPEATQNHMDVLLVGVFMVVSLFMFCRWRRAHTTTTNVVFVMLALWISTIAFLGNWILRSFKHDTWGVEDVFKFAAALTIYLCQVHVHQYVDVRCSPHLLSLATFAYSACFTNLLLIAHVSASLGAWVFSLSVHAVVYLLVSRYASFMDSEEHRVPQPPCKKQHQNTRAPLNGLRF